MKSRIFDALSLAIIMAMLVTSLVLADTIVPDSDIVTAGDQATQNLGTVAPGATLTPKVSFKLVCSGKQHVESGQTVNLNFNLGGSTVPGGSLSATNASIGSVPASWPDDTTGSGSTNCSSAPEVLGDNGDSTVTITAPTAGGTYTYVVRYNFAFSPSEGSGDANDIVGSNTTVSFILTVLANTSPTVTVTGVSNGASYEFGSVPAAGCSVVDTEDGNSSFSAALSAITGPFSAYGLGSQTASCSYTDSGGLSDSDSATYSIVDTTAPVIEPHADETEEATSPAGAIVNYTSPATSDAVFGAGTATCVPASGTQFALGDTTVYCDASDAVGNAAIQTSFEVHVVDTTPPVIEAHADVTEEATSSAGAIVNYTAPATADAVDGAGVATCVPASGTQFALGDTTVYCDASDAAGNAATQTSFVVHVVDTTPPTITFVSRTPANSNGWNNGDVTVNWSCTDLVGVTSASVGETVSSEGENQSVTGTCEDTSGNTASDTQTGINIDKTAPSITAALDKLPAANGWFNASTGAPTVDFTCSDLLSGLDGACPASHLFGDGENQSYSQSISDLAGNTASAGVSDVDVDTVAPSISVSLDRSPAVSGWFNLSTGAPVAEFTCSDGTSGISSCPSDYTFGEGENLSHSGTAYDVAGNSASASVSDVDVDLTAPSVIITAPANGGSYILNAVVASSYSCSDATSGVDTCVGPVTNGSNFSTNPVGGQSFTVNASDKAGNPASASNSYTVQYATGGMCYGGPGHTILQPINTDGSSIFKQKSTVPAKFRVCDAYGNSIGTPGVVVNFKLLKVISGTTESTVNEPVDSTTPDTAFRWSPTDVQWIFNINTKNQTAGKTYVYLITLNDGSTIEFQFGLK